MWTCWKAKVLGGLLPSRISSYSTTVTIKQVQQWWNSSRLKAVVEERFLVVEMERWESNKEMEFFSKVAVSDSKRIHRAWNWKSDMGQTLHGFRSRRISYVASAKVRSLHVEGLIYFMIRQQIVFSNRRARCAKTLGEHERWTAWPELGIESLPTQRLPWASRLSTPLSL